MPTCTSEPRIQIYKLVRTAHVAAIHVFGVFVDMILDGRDAPGHDDDGPTATDHPPVAFMPRAMAGWPS